MISSGSAAATKRRVTIRQYTLSQVDCGTKRSPERKALATEATEQKKTLRDYPFARQIHTTPQKYVSNKGEQEHDKNLSLVDVTTLAFLSRGSVTLVSNCMASCSTLFVLFLPSSSKMDILYLMFDGSDRRYDRWCTVDTIGGAPSTETTVWGVNYLNILTEYE